MIEIKSFTTKVPADLKDALSVYSERTGRDIQDIVAAMLHYFLRGLEDAQRSTLIEEYLEIKHRYSREEAGV